MAAPDAARVGRLAHVTVVGLSVVTVALVFVGAVIVWSELRVPDEFDPLHYTVPQSVTSRVNILSGAPAAHLGGTVDVTGEKCSDVDVDVIATTSWTPIEPRGESIVTAPSAPAQREAGCVTSRFQNEIPPDVVDVVRRQHARGYPAPLWEIRGVETPIRPNGEPGSPEDWYTEPFAIVARER